MVLVTNDFIACGANQAVWMDGSDDSRTVYVRARPEVQETVAGFPYVVRKTGFLMSTPPGFTPMVGETLTYKGTAWKIGKVVHTTYCDHYGISALVPSFLSGEKQTLNLFTSSHEFGCDAQDNLTGSTPVEVVVLHNNSSELLLNDALTFAESWRLYVDDTVALTLDHDSYFQHGTNPNLYYRVQNVVDIGRLDRLPFALARLTS